MFRHSITPPTRPARPAAPQPTAPAYTPNGATPAVTRPALVTTTSPATPATRATPATVASATAAAARFARTHADLPAGDYVSPELAVIMPDAAFPEMVRGDTNAQPWPWLRRQIPHTWYVDRRAPVVGFASRDEASILYNTARLFAGRQALEIGCWLGWSACHLALGGVELDVIDPLLSNAGQRGSVERSLADAGVLDRVRLHAGLSPAKVIELGDAQKKRWSLFFIDGSHDAPAPFNDTVAAERYAESDAMMLFHDLAAPEVSMALDYLQVRGWKTMLYQTMQVMGVAWRGNVEPVRHRPDPRVQWPMPAHLSNHPVSG